MGRALIELQNVSYRYPGTPRQALQNVTLRIDEGEWVTVVGGNGSGKTTLAWVLSGLLSPQQGIYLLRGEKVTEASLRTVRQTVGMIFQNPEDQIIQATVEDDIAFGLEVQGLPPSVIEQRVAWALDRLGLKEVRHREPYRLSGGQKKRLAVAGMIVLKPKALVLDEAFAMLDPKAQQDILALLRSLHREEGMAIIEVTHDMEQAKQRTRLVALQDGGIVYDGSPNPLFQDASLIQSLRLRPPLAVRLIQTFKSMGIEIDESIRGAFFERESEGIRALWRSSSMR
ncbi:MAG: ATP-binding cassette domain-containing protein [Candidatus Carbobacillus sp.]|nr:ATP-binding cassette domain-containing protein [Candidatus Carbobacillus sp.]